MVNPQLLQYVRAQRAAGVSKEDIIKALASGGWSAADAQEAFAAIDGPPPAAAAPQPPPAPRPVQASPQFSAVTTPRPVSSPASPMQPMGGMRVQSAASQPRTSSSYAAAQPNKRSRWPWVVCGLLIFFLLGIGAGAFAAVKYEWLNSLVSTMVGVAPAMEEESGSFMEEMEENPNTFLEVSPEPFGTGTTTDDMGSTTPAESSTTTSSTTPAE